MWRQRVLATALGIVLAGLLLAGVVVACMGRDLVRLFRVPHAPVDLALDDPAVAGPCLGDDSILLIAASAWSRPRSDPLVEQKIERDAKSAFARYSSHWAESRCVSFVLESTHVRAEARFETDIGKFSGTIRLKESHAHLEGSELCFDLAVDRNDGSHSQERWQAKIPIR